MSDTTTPPSGEGESLPKPEPGPWFLDPYSLSVCKEDPREGQVKLFDIRGWGHYTGRGALALSEAEGIARQKANGEFIVAAADPETGLCALRERCHAMRMALEAAEDAAHIGSVFMSQAEHRALEEKYRGAFSREGHATFRRALAEHAAALRREVLAGSEKGNE